MHVIVLSSYNNHVYSYHNYSLVINIMFQLTIHFVCVMCFIKAIHNGMDGSCVWINVWQPYYTCPQAFNSKTYKNKFESLTPACTPNKHIYVSKWKSMVWNNIIVDGGEIFNSHLGFLYKDDNSLWKGEGEGFVVIKSITCVLNRSAQWYIMTMHINKNLVSNVLIIYFMACKCLHSLR